MGELAPLHPRNSTFPGDVFLHVAVDVLDWCGASRAGPLALEGMSFPEWGLVLWKTGGSYLGGGDNAVFVRAMADFICGCSLFGWHAMWEDPWGAGVCDPDTKPGRPIPAPMSRAAFLEAFGS